jgi:hypothetical protein
LLQFYTLHGGGYIELLSPWTGSLQTKVIDTSADGVGTWVRLYGTVAGGLGTHYGPRLYTTTRASLMGTTGFPAEAAPGRMSKPDLGAGAFPSR